MLRYVPLLEAARSGRSAHPHLVEFAIDAWALEEIGRFADISPSASVSERPSASVSEPPSANVSEPPSASVSEPPSASVSEPPSANEVSGRTPMQ